MAWAGVTLGSPAAGAGLGRAVRRRWRCAALFSRNRPHEEPGRVGQLTVRPEARYSTKRDNSWVGYKVLLTESCDDAAPRLMTNVETTPATTPDDNMVEVVHRSLGSRGLLPSGHLVDKGYTGAKVLVRSQAEHGVAIVGLVAQDPNWQTRESTGFAKNAFAVNWEAKVVTCPEGKRSLSWLPSTNPAKGTVFEAHFARVDCAPCASRRQYTRSRVEPRIIGLQNCEHHEALQTIGRTRKRPSSSRHMPRAPASCAPTRKPSSVAACAAPAIAGSLNAPPAGPHVRRYQPAEHRFMAGRRAASDHPLLSLRGPSVRVRVIHHQCHCWIDHFDDT